MVPTSQPKDTDYEYLVQWTGCDSSKNSWEPHGNLKNCRKKLEQFCNRLKENTKTSKPFQFAPTNSDGEDSSSSETQSSLGSPSSPMESTISGIGFPHFRPAVLALVVPPPPDY